MTQNRLLRNLGEPPTDTSAPPLSSLADFTIPSSSTILNKSYSIRRYIEYMLNRCAAMFEYTNLPDSIPSRQLEYMLQTYGFVGIAEGPISGPPRGLDFPVHGKDKPSDTSNDTSVSLTSSDVSAVPLFAFRGGLSGPPDPYYHATRYIVANPSEQFKPNGFDRTYTIGKDVVIMKNDAMMIGLLPLHQKYAELLTEAEISLRAALVNLRSLSIIIADNDTAMASAQVFLDDLEAGKISFIRDKPITSQTRSVPSGSGAPSNIILQYMELFQYLKASWFNEMGLNTSFTMKREYVSAEEIAANTDILMPLVDDMLNQRQWALEQVNALFGTNISVKKGSAWENKQIEIDLYQQSGEPDNNPDPPKAGDSE